MAKLLSDKSSLNLGKRTAILEAALILFEKDGYSATPIPKIADLAKVATGTIYLYFPSKEAMVNEVWRTNKEVLKKFLTEKMSSEQGYREQFHTLYHSYLEFAFKHPVSFSFLVFHFHAPYLNSENIEFDRQLLGFLIQFLKDGQKKKIISKEDPEILLSMLDGSVSGLFKAVKDGKISLSQKVRASAEGLAWKMIAQNKIT